MKLIATKLGKTEKHDTLRCIRRDGSASETRMPRQGVLPHDLIHFVVESALGFRRGFLGLIAEGADIAFAMATAHELAIPATADQATQAEALVESLQAQLWSGSFDEAQFMAGLEGACAMRDRPLPDLSRISPERDLFQAALALGERWRAVPPHGTLELEMTGL